MRKKTLFILLGGILLFAPIITLFASRIFQPDANTVALWHMNEALWDGTPDEVKDASGNGYHGVSSGGVPTTVVGKFGKCGEFVKVSNDYVQLAVADIVPATNPFTIEAWIKTTGTADHVLISNNSGQVGRWDLYGEYTDKILFWSHTGGVLTGTSIVNDNKWHYIVVTRNGSDWELFVDGVSEDTDSSAGALNITVNYRIGETPSGAGRNFDGLIDEVRISDIARSVNEIRKNYLSRKPFYTN